MNVSLNTLQSPYILWVKKEIQVRTGPKKLTSPPYLPHWEFQNWALSSFSSQVVWLVLPLLASSVIRWIPTYLGRPGNLNFISVQSLDGWWSLLLSSQFRSRDKVFWWCVQCFIFLAFSEWMWYMLHPTHRSIHPIQSCYIRQWHVMYHC